MLFRDAHDLRSWPCANRVRLWNQRTRVDSRVGTYNKLCVFFFIFFPLGLQNFFIQDLRNYINDKNYNP